MVFPYDFGFIPSTLGDDGDPLDILILMESSVVPGCVVRTRIIGGIEAKQKEKGESWTKNDRLIAVATHAQTYQKAENLSDLRPHLIDEIIEFFLDYNKLRNRKFKAGAAVGLQKAKKLIEAGMKQFRRKTQWRVTVSRSMSLRCLPDVLLLDFDIGTLPLEACTVSPTIAPSTA